MEKEELDLDKIKTSKDLAIAIKKNLLVIIKISASWCGPCKNKKFLESYHNLKLNFSNNNNIKFIELDIDRDSEIIVDKKYYDLEIDSVPTFLLAKNGSFTKKFVGGGYLNEINEYILEVTKL
jgi:thiol-disulfide isomerase/thioredoxin